VAAESTTARDELRNSLWRGLPKAKRGTLLAAHRAELLREAAAEVWANRTIGREPEIEGWKGAHALLLRMAEDHPAPADAARIRWTGGPPVSTPSYVDGRLGDALKCWHAAPGGRPGTVALAGRQFFANGDGVTVLMRVSGDEALASDGGSTAARLADAGVDVWGTTRAAAAWTELLSAFNLREVDGRIAGRRPLGQAEQLASDIASAVLTADGLRWMAVSGPETTAAPGP